MFCRPGFNFLVHFYRVVLPAFKDTVWAQCHGSAYRRILRLWSPFSAYVQAQICALTREIRLILECHYFVYGKQSNEIGPRSSNNLGELDKSTRLKLWCYCLSKNKLLKHENDSLLLHMLLAKISCHFIHCLWLVFGCLLSITFEWSLGR